MNKYKNNSVETELLEAVANATQKAVLEANILDIKTPICATIENNKLVLHCPFEQLDFAEITRLKKSRTGQAIFRKTKRGYTKSITLHHWKITMLGEK